MKNTVLIICHANISKAPRVLKQISALKDNYHLFVAGFNGHHIPNVHFVDLARFKGREIRFTFHLRYPILLRKLISFFIKYFILFEFTSNQKRKTQYWTDGKREELTHLSSLDFNLIITHHLNSLPLALRLAKGKSVPVILNAHEYYPREFEENEKWLKEVQPIYEHYCKKVLPKIDQVFSVSKGIAAEYQKEYGVTSVVIPNDKPFYENLYPTPINEHKIKLVHHGAAIRDRKLEVMIDVLKYLSSNYELTFVLMPNQKEYFEELKLLAKDCSNIHFEDAVEVDKIPDYINQFDIGLYILDNNSFNHEYALPNKFFEFVQARLCLVMSPNTEMKNIIAQYDIGVVSEDFSAEKMAKKIQSLSITEIRHYKEQSHKFAYELSSEKTEQIILDEVNKLIK
jgi:hypothetical protein